MREKLSRELCIYICFYGFSFIPYLGMRISLSDGDLGDDVFLIDTIVDCIIRGFATLRCGVELCRRNLSNLIGRDSITVFRIK